MKKGQSDKDERRCFRCDQNHPDTFACPSDSLTSNDLIEQIRRAHASACPKPIENPAWANCHVDCGILLAELDRQRAEIERLREVLERWTQDGRLQTFEDRERFRAEVRKVLSVEGASAHETSAKPEALTRSEVVVEILDAIDNLIRPGDLQGNGTDETAYRNGLATAYNAISEQFGEFAPHESYTRKCPECGWFQGLHNAGCLRMNDEPASSESAQNGLGKP